MAEDKVPTLGAPSFKCPHCGAIAHQDWFELRAEKRNKDAAPYIPSLELCNEIMISSDISKEQKKEFKELKTKFDLDALF